MANERVGRKSGKRIVIGLALSPEQYELVEARRAKAEKAAGVRVSFTAILQSIVDAGLKR